MYGLYCMKQTADEILVYFQVVDAAALSAGECGERC